ncbi:hypothetical protein D3C80_2027940 [compost metagenome]
MCVQMADFMSGDTCLSNGDLHGPPRAVAVFRARSNMVGIGRCTVSDELGKWLRTARKRVAKGFNDKNSSPFAHDETITL